MKRLQGNQIQIRAHKNGKPVFGIIPDWVRDRLIARAAAWCIERQDRLTRVLTDAFSDKPKLVARVCS
jgi:hypothetical protein